MDEPRKLQKDFASVELYWLPLGAGDASHCVRWNGRTFEAIAARRHHRQACDLYHSALIVHLGGDRHTIDMPARGRAPGWSAGLIAAATQDAATVAKATQAQGPHAADLAQLLGAPR